MINLDEYLGGLIFFVENIIYYFSEID